VKFDFNNDKAAFDNLAELKGLLIERVDYLYSSNLENPDFDQNTLDKNRLLALKSVLPEAFDNNLIQWQKWEQDANGNLEARKRLFHGFVIFYRPKADEKTIEKEIAFIDDYLSGKAASVDMYDIESDFFATGVKIGYLSYSLQPIVGFCKNDYKGKYPSYAEGCKSFKGFVKQQFKLAKFKKGSIKGLLRFTVDNDGKPHSFSLYNFIELSNIDEVRNKLETMPKWNEAYGEKGDSGIVIEIQIGLQRFTDGTLKITINPTKVYEIVKYSAAYTLTTIANQIRQSDSLLINFFKRNNELKNVAVVCDVTGSMSPYIAQMLLWQKLNLAENKDVMKYFCFFNDGDLTPDHLKKTGSVGGIYMQETSDFDEIKNLAYKAMRNGGGGDCPENNFEATIATLNTFKKCDQVVMIADNYATPRDMALLYKIDKPVKIIVCGAWDGRINEAYLTAAKKLGGSVHTMESDIDNLQKLAIGQVITIEKAKYIWDGNAFKLMK